MNSYNDKRKNVSKIAVIGNYLPRKCGIATFTTDICNALNDDMKSNGNIAAIVMNDINEGYDYPDIVKFEIRDKVQKDYYAAAEFLNSNNYDIVILQHEYGIFGGSSGAFIIHLLKSLEMPVIVNLHTVVKDPTHEQKVVMNEIAKHVACITVMNRKAIELLEETYEIGNTRIEYIPHGIPDVPFSMEEKAHKIEGFEGREIILTFGLLGPGKGIEIMIDAMPGIIAKHPSAVYLILGQTHPSVVRDFGESYRHGLQQRVNQLGLKDHVFFHNEFVDPETLTNYLQSTKIYVVPYQNKEQITSGTLAFAVGSGCAVISTPFWHAEELLDEGRGVLVPFNSPSALTETVNDLLENDQKRNTIRLLAYQKGRDMIYREVSRKLYNLIEQVRDNKKHNPQRIEEAMFSYKLLEELPEIKLSHLKSLTDDGGLLHHAKYTVPDYNHGYCVDDNARGLLFSSIYLALYKDKSVIGAMKKYLSFLYYAFNEENGHFRNFLSYDRHWLELKGSEDSHGRALWALGIASKYTESSGIRKTAIHLFIKALPVASHFNSPRAIAFTVIGLNAYLYHFGGDAYARKLRTDLANRLFEMYKNNATEEWPWPEETVTYANAKLPQALIVAGQWIPNHEMFEMGKKSLEWLLKIQTAPEGHLSIIGNEGWLSKGGTKPKYDQQPLEAMNLLDACVDVYASTKDKKWITEAAKCIGWYLGRNDENTQIYDFETGGCNDGLVPTCPNENQGGESTICWLISLIRMYQVIGMSDMSLEKNEL